MTNKPATSRSCLCHLRASLRAPPSRALFSAPDSCIYKPPGRRTCTSSDHASIEPTTLLLIDRHGAGGGARAAVRGYVPVAGARAHQPVPRAGQAPHLRQQPRRGRPRRLHARQPHRDRAPAGGPAGSWSSTSLSSPSSPPHHEAPARPPHARPETRVRPRCAALLDALRPDVLLYDFLQPWAPLEAARRGIPAAHFSTCSAAAMAFFVHCLGGAPGAFPLEAAGLGSADEEAKYTEPFVTREDDSASSVSDRDRFLLSIARSEGFVAAKTCKEMEQAYMDYLSQLLCGKDILPCGPLLVDGSDSHEKGEVMRWMDAQDPGSVVLVSFGSEYFMSEQQIAEMARGLELSGERFLWVLRFPNSPDEEDAARSLPRGFEPARGVVVEGWAPQRRVLAHHACGAFLTHCGWSSVMESLAAGVPMVVLPLHIDQPLAAELGAAVVACAVRTVMRGEDGKAVRRRATELREVVARNDADDAQIGALLQRMARLCGKGQQGSQQVAVPNFLN